MRTAKALVVSVYCFAYLQITIRMIDVAVQNGHNWATGEWLINYAGGFVRRGLTGSILTSLPYSSSTLLIILCTSLMLLVTIVFSLVLVPQIHKKLRYYCHILVAQSCFPTFYSLGSECFREKRVVRI